MTPMLRVSLAFSPDEAVPVGRLALERNVAVFEYDGTFAATGLRTVSVQESTCSTVTTLSAPSVVGCGNGSEGRRSLSAMTASSADTTKQHAAPM